MIPDFACFVLVCVLLRNFAERKGGERLLFNVLMLQNAVLCNRICCDSQNIVSGLSSNNFGYR